ncbi:MAG TPA: gamma-glutamyl-gamma-aminobutyrate hydrolase family protein [Clostridia bacterium]|nr:gamma-glutamyl-gamma-aminobutyrate hydrolase family protein [Clostridia bacterium]
MTKPIIGISCDYDWKKETAQLHRGYYDAVLEAGGIPYLIPNLGKDSIDDMLDIVGGVMLTGGNDIDPMYFGESPHPKLGDINPYRDEMEIELAKESMDRDIPILGVCRGVQVMNIAMGGTIYQDTASQWKGSSPLQKHSQLAPLWYGSHKVKLIQDSKLRSIMMVDTLWTNSFHHQAIKEIAHSFHVTATCGDGIIEGIESPQHRFALGVQWHPEKMWEKDPSMLQLFRALVDATKS